MTPQFSSAHDLYVHYRAVRLRLAARQLPSVPDAPPLVPEQEPKASALTIEQRVAETIRLSRILFVRCPAQSRVVSARKAAAHFFDVTEAELCGPSRKPRFAMPRQIAAAIAYIVTGKSLAEVGWFLGGRDHSTIHHAVEKYRPLVTSVIAAEVSP